MSKCISKPNSPYYGVENDLAAYPDAWAYIIVGGRNTGKTYSALKWHLLENKKHVFIKRTNKDVDLLCSGNKLGNKEQQFRIDLSPYKAINRDFGCHIKAFTIQDGLGAFYKTDDEGVAVGDPVGYLLSLNAVQRYKGFDLSECDSIIFDEFIPQRWERIGRNEGEQLMDIYKTVSRDRTMRGRPELKLICLANAVEIYNPTCEILEITDKIADMQAREIETFYDDERGIFIRILKTSEEMLSVERQSGIYRAMKGTAWANVAFENQFAFNDTSCIKKLALKGWRPVIELTHKQKKIYIYSNGMSFYMCSSRAKCPVSYDLNREMDQRAFWLDHGIDLLNASTRGLMYFEKYTYYHLIVNFKMVFKLK